VFNHLLGASEQKVRELFKPAEEEWKRKKQDSALHVIIIDEIDALCRARGGGGGGGRAAFIHHIVDSLESAAFVKFTLSSNAAQKDVFEEGAISYKGDPMQRCVSSLKSLQHTLSEILH